MGFSMMDETATRIFKRPNAHVTGTHEPEQSKEADSLGHPCRLAGWTGASRLACNGDDGDEKPKDRQGGYHNNQRT